MNFRYRPFPRDLSGFARVLRRLAKAADGVETIEFALVSIALFLFLFGVIEFGRLYWTQSELQYAAEAAARYCTINSNPTATPPTTCTSTPPNPTVPAYAATKVYGISVPASAFTVTPYVLSTNTPACGNQVSVSYQFNFIVGSLFPYGPLTLSTTACHQV